MTVEIAHVPQVVPARAGSQDASEDMPPMALDAEAAVIADCLLHPESIEAVPFLRPEHFWHEPNRLIFGALVELAAAKRAIDNVTVAEVLREKGQLLNAGGVPYLAYVTDATPAVHNVEDHARIVLDRWKLRRLGQLGVEFAVYCRGQRHRDSAVVLERAQKRLADVAAEGAAGATGTMMGQAVRAAFEAIQAEDGSSSQAGVSTGFRDIDGITAGLRPGQLWVLGARPGRGKTSLATSIAMNVAFGQQTEDGSWLVFPRGVAFFSLEMMAPELAERVICAEARVEHERLRQRRLWGDDWSKLTEAARLVQGIPLWIDDTRSPTVFDIKARAAKKKREFDEAGVPLGLVVVDYLQRVKVRERAGRSREQEVAEVSKELKDLAGQLGCTVLALAQLSREVEKQGRPPRPSDLRESGQVEQDADLIAFIHEDAKTTPEGALEFLIQKQRSGPLGSVPLRWLSQYTRFEDYKPNQ